MTRSLQAAAYQISPYSDPDIPRNDESKTHRSRVGFSDVDNGVF